MRLCCSDSKHPLASIGEGICVAAIAGVALAAVAIPVRQQFLDFNSKGQNRIVEQELRTVWGKQGDYQCEIRAFVDDFILSRK